MFSLQIICTVLALITWIFDLAAATGPWITGSYSSNPTKYFFGGLLYQQEGCLYPLPTDNACLTVTYGHTNPWRNSPPGNPFLDDSMLPSLQAAAACLLLGFIGGFALFFTYVAAATGSRGLPIKVSGFFLAAWTFAFTVIGTVIAGAKTQSSSYKNGLTQGYINVDTTYPGLALSIIATGTAAILFVMLHWTIPHAEAEAAKTAVSTPAAPPAAAPALGLAPTANAPASAPAPPPHVVAVAAYAP